MKGEVVGNFRITREIATGGMGVVYEAEHVLIPKKRAAVKVLRRELSENRDIVRRFFTEANETTGIRHPGIIDIYDFGYHQGERAFIVMEMLEGETLERRLRKLRALEPIAAARIVRSVAGAVAAAHQHNIVHRDLKPDNIFLVPDADMPSGERVKVLDFGLAKLLDTQTAGMGTQAGIVLGTPSYMSPEQCAAGRGEIDIRADQYALGCIFFRLLCGRPPFVAERTLDLIFAHCQTPPPSPRQFSASVPAELEQIILTLLAKAPNQRFASMAALREALSAYLSAAGDSEVRRRSTSALMAQAGQGRESGDLAVSSLSGSAGQMAANQMAANQMAANQLAANQAAPGQITPDHVSPAPLTPAGTQHAVRALSEPAPSRPTATGTHSARPHSARPDSVGPHPVGPHPADPHPADRQSIGPQSMPPTGRSPTSDGSSTRLPPVARALTAGSAPSSTSAATRVRAHRRRIMLWSAGAVACVLLGMGSVIAIARYYRAPSIATGATLAQTPADSEEIPAGEVHDLPQSETAVAAGIDVRGNRDEQLADSPADSGSPSSPAAQAHPGGADMAGEDDGTAAASEATESDHMVFEVDEASEASEHEGGKDGAPGDVADKDRADEDRAASVPAADGAQMIALRLFLEPKHATVSVDGMATAGNPLHLPQRSSSYRLRIHAPGFVAKTLRVRADRDQVVRVKLQPEHVDIDLE